jgi:glutaminyl-peptide cyclotransferase
VRDPHTFAVQREITVTLHGEPVSQINELECVGNAIYANVWYQNYIVKIDKTNGRVISFINAEDIVNLEAVNRQARDSQAVLNGIAYDLARDVFYLTGKLWTKVFEVRLDEQ